MTCSTGDSKGGEDRSCPYPYPYPMGGATDGYRGVSTIHEKAAEQDC
jgi:hypothetical protein